MQKVGSRGGVGGGRVVWLALERQEHLEIGRGNDCEVVGGDEEAGLDLTLQRLVGERGRGVAEAAEGLADPRRVGIGESGGEAIGTAEGMV